MPHYMYFANMFCVLAFPLILSLYTGCTEGSSPPGPPRLLAPGEPLQGCVQGSEVMGGPYAHLPPCPPWVDEDGSCHIGDSILTESQCLGIMNHTEYMALSREKPEALNIPSNIYQPLPIVGRPPGWEGVGGPPGGWAPSHAPGSPHVHYGPPGTVRYAPDNRRTFGVRPPGTRRVHSSERNVKKTGKEILPPSIRNMRRHSSNGYVPAPVSEHESRKNTREVLPAPPAPRLYMASNLGDAQAPSVNAVLVRRESRRNRKRALRRRGRTGRRRMRRRERRRQRRNNGQRKPISLFKLFAPPRFHPGT